MPPKFKFTKEKIIDVCFEMARKDGIKTITARGVAAALGSSAKVIFGLLTIWKIYVVTLSKRLRRSTSRI